MAVTAGIVKLWLGTQALRSLLMIYSMLWVCFGNSSSLSDVPSWYIHILWQVWIFENAKF
jgi:hypothetical protein